MSISDVIKNNVDEDFNNITNVGQITDIGMLTSAYYGIYVKLNNGVVYNLTCKKVLPSYLEYQIDEFGLLTNSEKYKCFSEIKKYI